MIVCIPLRAPLADGERDAPVEPHLPRARYLHLYDTEARSGRTLDLSQLGQTESFRIEALLCTSLDRMTLRQLLQRGIRVNCVAPGPVWTPLNPSDRPAKEVAKFGEDSDMGRPAQPEEISPAFVFLASPVTASYVNGAILPVMGGPRG